jgi:uncharacterized protein YggE
VKTRSVILFTSVVTGLLALALAPSTSAPAFAARDATTRIVTTTAVGIASGTPDTATINLAVETHATTAAAVLAANADRTQHVLDGVKFVGVPPENVRTSGVSLLPTIDVKGRISGYTVSTRLTVVTHDVPNAGKVIDAATQLAGDDIRVEGVALSIQDTGAVMRAARTDAVRRATTQAAELARAARAHLGGVRTITEVTQSPPASLQAVSFDTQAGAALPIAAGSQQLTVNVKVVYDLR